MFPRSHSPRSLLRATRDLADKPSRLTLGVAAATAVTATGVAIALSAGTAPAAGSGAGGAAGQAAYGRAVPHAAAHRSAHAKLMVRDSRPVRHRQAPRHAVPAHHASPAHQAGPAHHASRAHHARPADHARAARPYLVYDSVTPSSIPAHHVVATYANGSYAASPSQVAGRHVVWIDTSGTDPNATALDVEPGDASPQQSANWAHARLSSHPNALAIIYTMRSDWPAVQAAIGTLPVHMRSQVRYWIADPTGVPHVVPGSAATQWYWGSSYDISTATPRF